MIYNKFNLASGIPGSSFKFALFSFATMLRVPACTRSIHAKYLRGASQQHNTIQYIDKIRLSRSLRWGEFLVLFLAPHSLNSKNRPIAARSEFFTLLCYLTLALQNRKLIGLFYASTARRALKDKGLRLRPGIVRRWINDK